MTTTAPATPAASAAATSPAKPAAALAKTSAKSSAAKAPKKAAKAAKPEVKPGKAPATRPAKAAAPIPVPATVKDAKAKKPKLVRDSFTIPKDEYAAIETLKQRCTTLAQPVKKSELLRAGLKLLVSLDDTALRAAVQAVPSIKTGRPKADAAPAAAQPAPKKAAKTPRK